MEVASSERDIDPFSSNASIMFTYEEVATATGRTPSPSAEREEPWVLASRFPFCRAVTMQENTSMSWLVRQVCPWLPLRGPGTHRLPARILATPLPGVSECTDLVLSVCCSSCLCLPRHRCLWRPWARLPTRNQQTDAKTGLSGAACARIADLEAFFDGIVPLQLERSDIAGASVLVMQNGQVLLEKVMDTRI